MKGTGLMQWLNEPPEWTDEDDTLSVVTGAKTDFWRKTHYGFIRDDGHFRHAAAPDDFERQRGVPRPDYQALYDAGRVNAPPRRRDLD